MMNNMNMSKTVKLSSYVADLFTASVNGIEFSNDPYSGYEDDLFAKFDGKEDKKKDIEFIDEKGRIKYECS